jgi:protein gp37
VSKNSRIEWTDHTFNPWWGCVKVSPACKHCYAEAWAKRVGAKVWGGRAPRRFFSEKHWAEPLRWNEEAKAAGQRHRVFCASMADVFEDRRELDPWRLKLGALIMKTPSLDWLLLTKRPDRASDLAPWGSAWPSNVWLGATVENQTWAARRLPELIAVPAKVRFLSCEPLLSRLDLSAWLSPHIHWVIAGGESGPKARPSDPAWFRELRDQCIIAGVPFHFKQWGNWAPADRPSKAARVIGGTPLVRVTKKAAGRHLDGKTWDQLPA